ncbi:PREDICTED: VQ motif-containing protein 4-like [Tarenaya hassleriana]|uniref:VQ motif-containing protein 4-like n=1 Tax=Tarenaya hassleriana TaxID=28532 RepID=UPI00053C8223|nr:PREDICTED: VQ motif-containing protein 4-like [Tarenaya hassleriana]
MENSPRFRDAPQNLLLPSPTRHNSSSCSTTAAPTTTTTRPVSTRSEPSNPYPTTFVQADTSSFKHVVQMLTGSSDSPKLARPVNLTHQPDPVPPKSSSSSSSHSIPPIKAVPNKKQSSPGFRLYERRNSLKNLKINPVYSSVHSGFSPRKPEILSPSILDFPALVLSPVTPLIPDPFDRSGSSNQSPNESGFVVNTDFTSKSGADLEERAIKEKGFFLHPSPATTPRESEPRLLPLFPVTSPRVSSGSSTS